VAFGEDFEVPHFGSLAVAGQVVLRGVGQVDDDIQVGLALPQELQGPRRAEIVGIFFGVHLRIEEALSEGNFEGDERSSFYLTTTRAELLPIFWDSFFGFRHLFFLFLIDLAKTFKKTFINQLDWNKMLQLFYILDI